MERGINPEPIQHPRNTKITIARSTGAKSIQILRSECISIIIC
jgi:hypothetical protein